MFYILDTSAIINDPKIILEGYPGHNIIIPITVIEELDKLKDKPDHPRKQARYALKIIDDIFPHDKPIDSHGVERNIGGNVIIQLNNIDQSDIPQHARVEKNDDIIIVVAYNTMRKHGENSTVLITQDRSMSIIARSWGIPTDYYTSIDDAFTLHKGIEMVNDQYIDTNVLYDQGFIHIEDDIPVNVGVVLGKSGIGLSDGRGYIHRINNTINLMGAFPRGIEQTIAASLMLGEHNGTYEEEFLGSLSGRPGSGKTFLALAAGLESVRRRHHDKIIIFRPTMPISKFTDIGFLPGDIEEKMNPWTHAISDVLSALKISDDDTLAIEQEDGSTRHISFEDAISIEPINYVRGRGFHNTFVIIDEAQNCEPHVIKTLISRLGTGSCVVMTWDPGQIDHPFVKDNVAEGPLSVLKETMGNDNVWHVELQRSERGGISSLIDY